MCRSAVGELIADIFGSSDEDEEFEGFGAADVEATAKPKKKASESSFLVKNYLAALFSFFSKFYSHDFLFFPNHIFVPLQTLRMFR